MQVFQNRHIREPGSLFTMLVNNIFFQSSYSSVGIATNFGFFLEKKNSHKEAFASGHWDRTNHTSQKLYLAI